jgi:hypothetical protein
MLAVQRCAILPHLDASRIEPPGERADLSNHARCRIAWPFGHLTNSYRIDRCLSCRNVKKGYFAIRLHSLHLSRECIQSFVDVR